MKLRVVGWTEFDDERVGTCGCSESALQAIIQDIKDNKYCFSGYDHQYSVACAPVLSDGKKRLFSMREFGGIMAKAHGDYSIKGYIGYSYGSYQNEDYGVCPDIDRWFIPDDFTPEEDFSEEIVVSVSEGEMLSAKEKLTVTLDDRPGLQFVDISDTLTLVSGEERRSFEITDMSRKKDFSKERFDEIISDIYSNDLELERAAEAEYANAKWVVYFELKSI